MVSVIDTATNTVTATVPPADLTTEVVRLRYDRAQGLPEASADEPRAGRGR